MSNTNTYSAIGHATSDGKFKQSGNTAKKMSNVATGITYNNTQSGLQATNVQQAIDELIQIPNFAGGHNSIYRGKYLGSSVTAEQYAAISAGTFKDLYIGDYWTIGDVNYRIAAFDYWLHTGNTECTTHHVVLVPDTIMYSANMNDTNTTAGGYVGSKMYTTNLNSAKITINSAFGSSHILNHRELLVNAADGGKASSWAWYDSTVELMSEVMVYGTHAWDIYTSATGAGFETGIDKSQLPLFAHDHACITNRSDWWLRGVSSSVCFCGVSAYGNAGGNDASYSLGVRPAFAIC